MTPEERQQIEAQIQSDFSELQKKLENLKNEVQTESDESKKQEKNKEIQILETELAEIKSKMDTLSALQEEEVLALKTRLEEYRAYKQEILDIRKVTPTTYEVLKDSETYNRLLNIISSNPKKFKDLKKDEEGNELDTTEKKLEYIFKKIRKNLTLFLKNKLWDSEKIEYVINNTIAPAFEWSLMELLRDQWNKTNISMLKGMDKISFDNFKKLIDWVSNFAKKTRWSFDKFSHWVNAIDYLSVHNWVLGNPTKSEVLSNPLKFKDYMNDPRFATEWFSPYVTISDNIFKIDENQNFEFGISSWEKQQVLQEIWNIQVVNNPKTTALIVKMLGKSEKILQKTEWLQNTANGLLDWINSINSVTKMFWVDVLWEISKSWEKSLAFKILDFVCKLIWITGGLEWIVKRWRMDRMNLTNEKNENISQIFKNYKELAWENVPLSITDENSCKTALSDFEVTDPNNSSTTKWDILVNVMSSEMDVNLLSPVIVKQILWDSYLKKEEVTENWNLKEKIMVDESKFTDSDKIKLAHNHVALMKSHLESFNTNDLSDFYTNIHSTEDVALCMIAALYVDKEDVIEWVKAKVFLPENYGSVHLDWTLESWDNESTSLPDLTSDEKAEMEKLVEQSKTPNTINYLENPTYKKYLNIIERDLKLPKYALECVCRQESFWWYLYKEWKIVWSDKGAQWLFQFMPETANQYMVHNKLKEKYWKTFTSRIEFLKDPLATARAAWIMYSELMNKYNFQTSLACYNRWIDNYQQKIGKKNLEPWDLNKLPSETKRYVETISKDILEHNSANSNDIFADLWKYSWDKWNIEWSSMA